MRNLRLHRRKSLIVVSLLATLVFTAVLVPVAAAQEVTTETEVLPATLARISWGAVIAGAIISLIIQLALNLLAIGIGVSTINPQYDDDNPSPQAIGIGAIASVIISALISLFIGGWLAARFAGIPEELDAALHGIMVWGVVTLLVLLLMSTAIGRIISGLSTIIGQGLRLAGAATGAVAQGAATVAQGAANVAGTAARGAAHVAGDAARTAANAAQNAAQSATSAAENAVRQNNPELAYTLSRQDQVASTIRDEAFRLLGDAGIQREQVEGEVRGAAQEATQAVRQAAQNPQEAQQIIGEALNRVFQRGQAVASQADRDALLNVMTSRMNMDRARAEQMLGQWETRFNEVRGQVEQQADSVQYQVNDARMEADQRLRDARREAENRVNEVRSQVEQRVEETREEVERRAREVAQATTQAISRLALAAFVAILVGGIAGGLGGLLGTPDELPDAEIDRALPEAVEPDVVVPADADTQGEIVVTPLPAFTPTPGQ